MTRTENQILTTFQQMNSKDRQTALCLAVLVVTYPDFWDVMMAATPSGKTAPPWEITERLVAEWMAKGGALCGQETN